MYVCVCVFTCACGRAVVPVPRKVDLFQMGGGNDAFFLLLEGSLPVSVPFKTLAFVGNA